MAGGRGRRTLILPEAGTRRAGFLALAVCLLACGGTSRADRIVGDETLFNEHYPEAIAMMRDECPAFAEAAGTQMEQTGAAITNAGLSAAVPEGFRPDVARVTERHGAPDSVVEGVHYYDDIGLKADATGTVVEVVMPCVRP